jgi:hypothetical protein
MSVNHQNWKILDNLTILTAFSRRNYAFHFNFQGTLAFRQEKSRCADVLLSPQTAARAARESTEPRLLSKAV